MIVILDLITILMIRLKIDYYLYSSVRLISSIEKSKYAYEILYIFIKRISS